MNTRFVAAPTELAGYATGTPPPPVVGSRSDDTEGQAGSTGAVVAKDRFVPSGAATQRGPGRLSPQWPSVSTAVTVPVRLARPDGPREAPVGLVDASPDVGGPAGPRSAAGRAGPPSRAGPAATAARLRLSLAAEFGALGGFLVEDAVTDVFINGERGGLWVDRGDGLQRDGTLTLTEREVRDLAVRLIGLGGRHIDEATPCVDVRLPGGVRVHAVLPPVSVSGTLVSIRVPQVRRLDLTELGAAGMFDSDTALELATAVRERTNLLLTGAAGTGKTTLLGAMLASAPPSERIVAIEDVAELGVNHPHFVSLESRQPNLEGAGAISMDRLVREALRMRPDRLVVGECRGAEVRELLAALNTGHDGGAGTLHANSLADVPARIEALGALAGMTTDAVARQTVSAIGLVIHLERVDGVRRVARQGRFALDEGGRLTISEVPA